MSEEEIKFERDFEFKQRIKSFENVEKKIPMLKLNLLMML